jgi:hypothetical protein
MHKPYWPAVAVPGATAQFLIDPANPTVITFPTP